MNSVGAERKLLKAWSWLSLVVFFFSCFFLEKIAALTVKQDQPSDKIEKKMKELIDTRVLNPDRLLIDRYEVSERESALPKRILYFLNHLRDGELVKVNIGRLHGVELGSTIRTFRQSQGEDSIPTGKLQVVQVQEQTSVAKILEDGTPLSAEIFPEFANVMAGDFIELMQQQIRKVRHILPQIEFAFEDLFVDPRAHPSTFALSRKGKSLLRAKAMIFSDKHLSHLFIRGFTGRLGSKNENQLESVLRAQTVKRFLVSALKFSNKRLVALGFGEYHRKFTGNLPGQEQSNRRIVIGAAKGGKETSQ